MHWVFWQLWRLVLELYWKAPRIEAALKVRKCLYSALIKEHFVDPSLYLWSWVGDDCCAWQGIVCSKKTGHIIELDLRNGALSGDQIHSSLLDLKYLTYLDLSLNYFYGIQIPDFFGSFRDLTYLNLSFSHFEGLVPHHLGNLSSLQYLDLNDNFLLSIDNMGWLSKLSMLKYLDLFSVNLSRATHWFPPTNMLSSSISVLNLYKFKF